MSIHTALTSYYLSPLLHHNFTRTGTFSVLSSTHAVGIGKKIWFSIVPVYKSEKFLTVEYCMVVKSMGSWDGSLCYSPGLSTSITAGWSWVCDSIYLNLNFLCCKAETILVAILLGVAKMAGTWRSSQINNCWWLIQVLLSEIKVQSFRFPRRPQSVGEIALWLLEGRCGSRLGDHLCWPVFRFFKWRSNCPSLGLGDFSK